MLTFEQKLAVIESFPELERKDVSLGRINYHYEGSVYDKKNVVYHLHPNGNGYVYAGHLKGYATDDKGLVNIRDYGESELRELVEASIRSLTGRGSKSPAASNNAAVQSAPAASNDGTAQAEPAAAKELWTNPEGQKLTVTFEDDLWYIYTGASLESACETYEEVEEYMQEEGFSKQT